MSKVEQWARVVGFKNIDTGAYRGRVNEIHLPEVRHALESMALSQVYKKEGFEIWSTEDDKEVVLLHH